MRSIPTGLAALALAFAASLAQAEDGTRTITVNGTGSVEAEPDMATMSIGVTHQAKEASEAMAMTSEAVASVLARLEASGIDSKDIQTNRLTVNPVWSNRRGNAENPPVITGFVASNSVSVRVLDLSNLGSALDQVLSEGANDFGNLRFGLQDPQPVADEARRQAVADAMSKARLYAEAAGVTLGDLVSLSEHGGQPVPMMMEMAAARDSSVPIAKGEVSVSASVTMVFEIGS